MKIRQRAIIAFGLLTVLLGAGATPASAEVTSADRTVGKTTVTRGELVTRLPNRTTPASVTTALPTTSPAVIPTTDTFGPCPTGYACAWVYSNGHYYEFKFYYYNTYRLYNWYNFGSFQNAQTGGAGAAVLDINGRPIVCNRPGETAGLDWTPAYYIRLTPNAC